MSAVFLKILNMSIAAGWLILAVLPARLLLKKAPRWSACLLWGLVGLRLLFPFSLKSVFSLLPSSQTIPPDIALSPHPSINSGLSAVNEAINPVLERSFTPAPVASMNPFQFWVPVVTALWLIGVAGMLLYAGISFWKLKRTVSASVPLRDRVLACDEIQTPFLLGVFRPIICVPSSMQGEALDYVLNHEYAHLARRDHWWKSLGFVLLAVHWFNPLCWLAFVLLCRDIEVACDERVIRSLDRDAVAGYSQTLLDCSLPRKRIIVCPLAFGETGVKQRVRAVLRYKKPAFWITLLAMLVCAALAVCLLTDPAANELEENLLRGTIRESAAAKLELPDGASVFVDSEIALLRGFADLRLREVPLEPGDREEDWRYRITFNPSERVKGAEEIVVSFHDSYVQIGSEYWLPEEGVPYESILEWAALKFDYCFSAYKASASNALPGKGRDVSQYLGVFAEHPYLRTGYIVFPNPIPVSGISNGAEFFDYAYNAFLDPTAEIILRCTYDDADFAGEIERLENLVKSSPAGGKPLLKDDGTRFSVPAYIAEYAENFSYEYAAVTGPREITYVYLAFRYPDEIEALPAAALPLNYALYHARNGAHASDPKDSYNVYEFLSTDNGGHVIRCISYTDDDWPVN